MQTLQEQVVDALLDHIRNSHLRFQIVTLTHDEAIYYFHLNFDQILSVQFQSMEATGMVWVVISSLEKAEAVGTGQLSKTETQELSLLSGDAVRAFIHYLAALLESAGKIWLEARTGAAPIKQTVPVAISQAKATAPAAAKAKPKATSAALTEEAVPAPDFDDIPF